MLGALLSIPLFGCKIPKNVLPSCSLKYSSSTFLEDASDTSLLNLSTDDGSGARARSVDQASLIRIICSQSLILPALVVVACLILYSVEVRSSLVDRSPVDWYRPYSWADSTLVVEAQLESLGTELSAYDMTEAARAQLPRRPQEQFPTQLPTRS
jgi:hypothetical protein